MPRRKETPIIKHQRNIDLKMERFRREKGEYVDTYFAQGFYWPEKRRYKHYNNFFSGPLSDFFHLQGKVEIADVLKHVFSNKKKIDIFEDGPGTGLFLARLKKELKKRGVDSDTSAIGIFPHKKLKELVEKKRIDKFEEEIIETHVPEKKFDFVISLFGGFYYTLDRFRKDVTLKLAYSLKPGGVMALYFATGFNMHSEEAYKLRTFLIRVEKAFEKRGFRAEFIHDQPEGIFAGVMVVQRLK